MEQLVKDGQSPSLVGTSGCLPIVPHLGSAVVTFTAGYGAGWENVPSDLSRATLITASEYYNNRDGGAGPGFPKSAASLLETYRKVRLGAS